MNKNFLCLILGCLLANNFVNVNAMQNKLTILKQKLQNLQGNLGTLKNSLGELKKKLGKPSGSRSVPLVPLSVENATKFEAAKTALKNAAMTDINQTITNHFTPLFDQGIGFGQAIEFAQNPDFWTNYEGILAGNQLLMELAVYGQGIDQAIIFVGTRIKNIRDEDKDWAEGSGEDLLVGLAAIADSTARLKMIKDALGDIKNPSTTLKTDLDAAIKSINENNFFDACQAGLALGLIVQKTLELLETSDKNDKTTARNLFRELFL